MITISKKKSTKFAVVSTIDGRTTGPGIWWGDYISSYGETELEAARAFAVRTGKNPKDCLQIAENVDHMSSKEILESFGGYYQLLPISNITEKYVDLICNNGFDMRVKVIDGVVHKLSNSDVTRLMTLYDVEVLGRNFVIDDAEIDIELAEFNSDYGITDEYDFY